MKNVPLLLVTLVGTVALIVGIAVMFSKSSPTDGPTVDQAVIVGEARLSKGPATAKVTIVEFSDFQCPACSAISPLVASVANQYPNDVRVIYRHFPLTTIHKNALVSAHAAEASQAFGKFWEMHDVLFEKQREWENAANNQAALELMANYAQGLGIDKQQFLEKIESDSIRNAVNQDVSLATQLGLNATPTIFVNDQQLSAPATQLQTAVENALK